MKVIEKGKVPEAWSVEIGCLRCDALLHIEEQDVKTKSRTKHCSGGYGEGSYTENYSSWTCPECGSDNELPSKLARDLATIQQATAARKKHLSKP